MTITTKEEKKKRGIILRKLRLESISPKQTVTLTFKQISLDEIYDEIANTELHDLIYIREANEMIKETEYVKEKGIWIGSQRCVKIDPDEDLLYYYDGRHFYRLYFS